MFRCQICRVPPLREWSPLDLRRSTGALTLLPRAICPSIGSGVLNFTLEEATSTNPTPVSGITSFQICPCGAVGIADTLRTVGELSLTWFAGVVGSTWKEAECPLGNNLLLVNAGTVELFRLGNCLKSEASKGAGVLLRSFGSMVSFGIDDLKSFGSVMSIYPMCALPPL